MIIIIKRKKNLQIFDEKIINYLLVIKSSDSEVSRQAELTDFCLFYFAYSSEGRRKKIEEEFHRN